MNSLLKDVTYPTAVLTFLPSGALFARFDPTGRFIAAGRHDGQLVIWDMDVREPARVFDGHVKALTSVSWSRNGRYVLASSKDWNVTIWNMAAEEDPPRPHAKIRFDCPVASAHFHPRNSQIVLVLLSSGEAYLVDLRPEHRGRYELVEMIAEPETEEEAQASRSRPAAMTTAGFDPSGKHVFVGMTNSCVLVFNVRTKTMVARHRIAGAGQLRSLDFGRSGRRTRMVTNSTDRTIRLFTLPATYPTPPALDEAGLPAEGGLGEYVYLEQDLEPTHRFSDPITRTTWMGMTFSKDGEILAGGAADAATHKIYLWDIVNDGALLTTLDGGREPLVDVHWHPTRPRIASTTRHGNVLVWHAPAPERWGAFAGGFEEVDENVWYEEREDEFDIQDEDELARRKAEVEDKLVDIDGFDDDPVGREKAEMGEEDEETQWAEDVPDDDVGGWKLKVWMEDDDDVY